MLAKHTELFKLVLRKVIGQNFNNAILAGYLGCRNYKDVYLYITKTPGPVLDVIISPLVDYNTGYVMIKLNDTHFTKELDGVCSDLIVDDIMTQIEKEDK